MAALSQCSGSSEPGRLPPLSGAPRQPNAPLRARPASLAGLNGEAGLNAELAALAPTGTDRGRRTGRGGGAPSEEAAARIYQRLIDHGLIRPGPVPLRSNTIPTTENK